MKVKLYQTLVCSMLTNACEAWNIANIVKLKINGFNNRCLHVITKNHYSNEAGNPEYDVLSAIFKRHRLFLGHMLRMNSVS